MNMWNAMGDAMASAQASQTRYPHLRGGYHILEIDKAELKPTRQHGDAMIVECNMLATSGRNAIGMVTWYQGSKHRDSYLSAVKGFILAVLTAHPDLADYFVNGLALGPIGDWDARRTPWGTVLAAVGGETNAFKGRIIACWSRPKRTQVRQVLILDHRFEAAPPKENWPVFDALNPPPDLPDTPQQHITQGGPVAYPSPPPAYPALVQPPVAYPAPQAAPVAYPAPVPPPQAPQQWGAAPPPPPAYPAPVPPPPPGYAAPPPPPLPPGFTR